MKRNLRKLTALALAGTLSCCTIPVFAAENNTEDLVSKTAARISEEEYKVTLKVPGDDGTKIHDEVILMVDGSYSGDDEWNSMVDTIVGIGETVLNGNGNTQLTLMAFGMGDNEVVTHAKTVEEIEETLGSLPGSLLYGRSSTNNEAGFTGVAEYIENHDDTLNNVHVLYISDGETNTDETPANFYDWKNNGWHRLSEPVIIGSNFSAEIEAIQAGANPSNAFTNVLGEDIDAVIASASDASYETLEEYNAQIWADVYEEAGLDPEGEYPVSDVERAFVDYDNKYNTYIQDNFYYALVGRGYPNRTARTVAAAEELAAMDEVRSLYIIDSNRSTEWMQNVADAEFVPAGSVSNLLNALEGALTNLAKTPFNNVVITDYMSKWVNLDPESLAIVDDTTGETIWTVADGWLIDEGRPTDQETPVVIELVNPIDYARGGVDTEGNTHGDIYRLTWYVKDGAMLRSENYHLEYNVTVDILEHGYTAGTEYPANGTTTVDYEDEDGVPQTEDIDVPDVETEEEPTSIGRGSDTATGYYCTDCGSRDCDHYAKITKKGNWFMYNTVTLADGESKSFAIQAGNNKNNDNIVGEYTITRNGNSYYVTYEMIDKNFEIKDEHLGILTKAGFKAKPGQDDNCDYGEWVTVDGVKNDTIYVFAHFSINY